MATERQLQISFLRAVKNIVGGARFVELRRAIESGDYESALSAVDIDNAVFDDFRGKLLETYAQAGVNEITGKRWPVPVRWNSATPQAESYARDVVGQHITVITNDMRDAVRWTIGDGIAFGRSPNKIALDIVGRVGSSGAREGGIVGLNRPQSEWVANMRRYLNAGDVASIMGMSKRDKRFDSMIRKAAESGKPLTQAQIDRITQSYSNKLLQSRGLTIARTERGLAVNMGRMEAWRQSAQKIGIPESAIVKEWLHTGRSRVDRVTHMLSNGQTVQGLNTPFNVGGVFMQCPHDPAAPASEVINCMCEVRMRLPKNWREFIG